MTWWCGADVAGRDDGGQTARCYDVVTGWVVVVVLLCCGAVVVLWRGADVAGCDGDLTGDPVACILGIRVVLCCGWCCCYAVVIPV